MNEIDPHHLRTAAALLKAMANERRLLILCQLGQGEQCVGELAGPVGLGQSALSQHLAKLRAEGLVATRRQGQTIFYRLASAEVAAVIEVLAGLYCGRPADNHPLQPET
ncbi:ArsR/SmtB family transcription factor [Azospirillum thermophilum]|uniref:ArsR family transcriptional regulator n=1 Tax=Azospirillum thermophilum TaxID=2202148 RepID=A0A2S2CW17_9PROT|nr:metalloregulator ArsR/SmtB family transcription factor [Azospirillum thermophilum]AWK88669.1 ArsR family transcriptional regulator [Azospirillum thermophilum]